MFRVLSEEEARRVTRWQAPEIKGAVPVARTRQVATPVKLDASGAEPSSLSASIDPAADNGMSVPAASGDDVATQAFSTPTTQVPLNSPSADMLQSSYDEGHARGLAEGAARAEQTTIRQMQALIATLGSPALKVPDAELEQEVMSLSMEIASLVLGRELQQDARSMAELVSRGIQHLPSAGSSTVNVHLHPEDVAMLEEFAEWPGNVVITPDDSLRRSDCRVVSGASTVHAGKHDWLAILRAELGLLLDAGVDD